MANRPRHRLFVHGHLQTGRALELDRQRAHYLTRVLRLRLGEELECFDGTGGAWAATLSGASSRGATLEIGERVRQEPEPAPRIHLAQGLLKGDAMDLVVQKATELGTTDLWPILADRSNVPRDPARQARKLSHWQRVLESAAEQCGTLHLPRLHPPRDLAGLLGDAPADLPANLVLLDPGSPTLPVTMPRVDICVLVGPEGGWSDAERETALQAGAVSRGLGTRVLRGETVPLAVLAALRHGWGWS